MNRYINTPIKEKDIEELRVGDYVFISGNIYTARDAAHKRLYDAMLNGNDIPFDLENNIIYYLGPTPEREGQVIGSAGPTTSSRMDKYTPLLLNNGLGAMIGKGNRSKEVVESIVENKSVYFAAIGGAGALLSKKITRSSVIAYDDLGTEAIREITLDNFPVIVAIDSMGNNLYETAISDYLNENANIVK